MLLGISMGVAGFTLFLLLHWAMFHWCIFRATFKNLVVLFALSLAIAWIGDSVLGQAFDPAVAGNFLVRATATLLVFACCFVLYMPFYYTVATSLSVQTMIVVEQAGSNGRPLSYLENLFASKEVLRARLEIMVNNGYLVQEGGRYRATAKGSTVSRVFGGLKRLWRLGAGG